MNFLLHSPLNFHEAYVKNLDDVFLGVGIMGCFLDLEMDLYSEVCQASEVEIFSKIVHGWNLWTIFSWSSILDVWHGSEYATVYYRSSNLADLWQIDKLWLQIAWWILFIASLEDMLIYWLTLKFLQLKNWNTFDYCLISLFMPNLLMVVVHKNILHTESHLQLTSTSLVKRARPLSRH